MPYVVDGFVLPIRIGGHPALDFCNTASWDQSAAPHEFLVDYPHLAVWARENGLVDAATARRLHRAAPLEAAAAVAVLDRARAFRRALHDVLVGPARPQDWAGVNLEVGRAAASMVLRPGGVGATWELPDSTGLARPLLAVAWSAADLLTSPLVATVGVCPGHGCGGLFSDPRGRRRWCSMSLCGNRAKVRRFATRAKGP